MSAFEQILVGIDWAASKGAYGPSDGSVEHADVPGALRTLMRGDELDEDTYRDALAVLQSHVWHQGDVFDVTLGAVPLLFQIIENSRASTAQQLELAQLSVLIADSARRYRQGDDPERHALADKILGAFAAEKAALLAWLGGPLAESAVFIATCVPSVREAVLLGLETVVELPFFGFLGLAELDAPPAWVLERAVRAVSSELEATRFAAARLLARHAKAEGDLLTQLEAALVPHAAAMLERVTNYPWDVTVPLITAPFSGELREGTVLLSGTNLVVVQLPALPEQFAKNVTLHWGNAGFVKGQTVRIGLNTRGEPRVLERTQADGSVERVDFTFVPPNRFIPVKADLST